MSDTDDNNINENEINNNEEGEGEISTKTVFVSGLPYETTEEELKKVFENCGAIKDMKIPKYQDTGRNIGYAHITFKKKKAVKKVKNINIQIGFRTQQH
jgi:RNA recognition motif-containing protein